MAVIVFALIFSVSAMHKNGRKNGLDRTKKDGVHGNLCALFGLMKTEETGVVHTIFCFFFLRVPRVA